MDLLLIVVLILLGGFGLHGYLRGLVRMVFSLAAVSLAILLASWAAPYTAQFLKAQTPLYAFIQEKCMEAVKVDMGMAVDVVADLVVERIAWTLTFILVVAAFGLLAHALDIIAKLPGIDSINHIGGLIVGLAEGLLVVWILFYVIALCQGSEWGAQMMDSIQEDQLLKFLYDNNILDHITAWFGRAVVSIQGAYRG